MTASVLPADDLLGQRLRQACPRALLIPSRILRRVIKKHRGLGGLGLAVPHRKSYVLDRSSLLALATPAELGIEGPAALPEVVYLFPRPEAAAPEGAFLVRYWRLLFHISVHVALREARLPPAALRERIRRLGPLVFEEAREVLRQENLLFAAGDEDVYEELASVYLELHYFDPHRLGQYFPAVLDRAAALEVLSEGIDAEALFRRLRPEGAPEPAEVLPREPEPPSEPPESDRTTTAPGEIRLRAEEVARAGNQVRAAILLERAIPVSPPTQAGALHGHANSHLEGLVGRLQAVLGFPASQKAEWAACLRALLPAAASTRIFNGDARLLYDLQKVCVDRERPLYAADLVEWFTSFFRRPIKRPLPDQPLVLTVKHLRSALNRLPSAHLPADARHRLSDLVREALHAAEAHLREAFRPKIVAALDRVGLVPAGPAEALSRDQLVEELLDRIAARGFIGLGDLRDALARSRVKLPDLRPGDLVSGDPLLKANRELARDLDGIYRGGEVYLRWLQTLSSLFFGTAPGRFLSLYLILPLLGSLMILKGIDEVLELSHKFLGVPAVERSAEELARLREKYPRRHHHPDRPVHTFNLYSFVALAVFLLPLIHVPPFRRAVFRGLWYLWVAVRGLLHDLPAAFLRLPLVRAFLQSKPYLVFWHLLGKPLVCVLPVALLLLVCGVSWPWALGVSAGLLVVASVTMNTALGAVVEETTADWMVRTWQLIRDDLVPGLFRWISWLSSYVLERVSRLLYAVDESLRFQQGQGRAAFVSKLVLGLFWFFITYLVQFVIVVLVEPQINPIKHFPVVTVSHKMMLLLVPTLSDVVEANTDWSRKRAEASVFFVLGLVPGLFGFLAWELMANWRLYRANQSATIDPAVVGSHGEWVINLVRPGFHSGTLPKLYARLRRAEGTAARKRVEGLHHVEEELHRFIERELIAVLATSRPWQGGAKLGVGHVHLATSSVRVEVTCPELGPGLWIELANRGGRLVANIPTSGWLAGLSGERRGAFLAALTGLYKRAGVDLVEEHLAAVLPAGAELGFSREGLTVTLGGEGGAFYDLDSPEAPARPLAGPLPEGLSATAAPLLFAAAPLTWDDWSRRWGADRAGAAHEQPLLPGFHLLPTHAGAAPAPHTAGGH